MSGRTILYVEDNEVNRKIVRDLLRRTSYRLIEAHDGEAGVAVTATADVGDYEGHVEAEVEGDGTTIAFNARYLADVLGHVDTERFTLEFNGPLSPGVFRPTESDDYVHVVMPVRTTS